MAWKVDTEPATEPVALAEVKADLKMDDITDDDTTLTELIKVARVDGEQYTQRKFIDTTINEYYSSFGDCLELSLSPVSSITEIYYVNADGINTELTSANYQTDLISEPSKIFPKVGGSFPDVQSGAINPIRVKYVVGYGAAASDVPDPIKKSIRMIVGDLYKNPEDRVNKEKMLSRTQL
jgi:uncharacterized phiE125 gp8 family phage protein